VPDLLDLSLVLNPGAVFGIGAGKRWFFIGFTGAAWPWPSGCSRPGPSRKDAMAHAAIGL
jgi:hypothetical protein